MLRLISIALAFVSLSVAAHDARPIYVEVSSTDGTAYETRLKVPDAISIRALPRLVLPDDCALVRPGATTQHFGSALVDRGYQCGQAITGRDLVLQFPGANPSLSTVIRVTLPDGVVHSTILPPGEYSWQVPHEENAWAVAWQYAWLGVKHIWLGIDHLLFVVCLLFVAKTWRRILVTITGFTIAHSVTLVMSVLGWVNLPIPVVEAIIALSIVFLALEILKEDKKSWTFQYPVAVAVSFGLLHGFGFASVLRELGLPQTELPTALFAFNVGVEIGQVVFIAAIMLLVGAYQSFTSNRESNAEPSGPMYWRVVSCYLVGTLSAFWLIDRTSGFWV